MMFVIMYEIHYKKLTFLFFSSYNTNHSSTLNKKNLSRQSHLF